MLTDWEQYPMPSPAPPGLSKMSSRHSDVLWEPSTVNILRDETGRVVIVQINGYVNGDVSVLYSWDWDADRDHWPDWLYPLLSQIGAFA